MAAALGQQQQGLDVATQQANAARALQAGQQYGALGQGMQALALQGGEAQLNAGGLQQQTEQAGKTALYNQFQQQQGFPYQQAQFLANIALGTGAQSGSTTTTTSGNVVTTTTYACAFTGVAGASQGGGCGGGERACSRADFGGVGK